MHQSVNSAREYIPIDVLITAPYEYLIKVLLIEYGGVLSQHLETRRQFATFIGDRSSRGKDDLKAVVSHE